MTGSIITVGDFKRLFEGYSDNRRVAFQMIDGEYDCVGFIDDVSDEHEEFVSKYYLTDDTQDVLLLICKSNKISSQF